MNDSLAVCPHRRAKIIPEQPPTAAVNKYRLTSRKYGMDKPENWIISVDNFSPELLDTDRFRLCFMSNRQGKSGASDNVFGWRCRMLYDLNPHPKDLMTPDADPTKWFLPITDGERFLIQHIMPTPETEREVIFALEVLSEIFKAHYSEVPDGYVRRFDFNGRRDKLEVGFAIWEKTGKGRRYGWERVSNISGLQLRIQNRKLSPTNDRLNVEYTSSIISVP